MWFIKPAGDIHIEPHYTWCWPFHLPSIKNCLRSDRPILVFMWQPLRWWICCGFYILVPLISFLCDSQKCRRQALAFKGQRREDAILPFQIHQELSILQEGMRYMLSQYLSSRYTCPMFKYRRSTLQALLYHCIVKLFLFIEDHHHSVPNLPWFISLETLLRCKNMKFAFSSQLHTFTYFHGQM